MSNVGRRRAATTGNALPGSTRPVPRPRPRWRMAAVGASACAVLGTGLVLATPPAGGVAVSAAPLGVTIASYAGDATTTPERVGARRLRRDLPGHRVECRTGYADQRGGARRPAGRVHARHRDRQRVCGLDHGERQRRHLVDPLPGGGHIGHADLHRDDRRPGCTRVGRHLGIGFERPDHDAQHGLGRGRGHPGGRPDHRRERRRELHRPGGVGHLHDHAHRQRAVGGDERHRDGHLQRRLRRVLRRQLHRRDDVHRPRWWPVPVDRHRPGERRQRNAQHHGNGAVAPARPAARS